MAISCIVWMVNTLISGEISTIDFDDWKWLWNISEKDWPAIFIGVFYTQFEYTPRRREHSWAQGIISLEAIFRTICSKSLCYITHSPKEAAFQIIFWHASGLSVTCHNDKLIGLYFVQINWLKICVLLFVKASNIYRTDSKLSSSM